jgi:Holliday junction DNA helicase RuvA
MIVGLKGKIEENNITNIHLNVNNIIYKIYISLKTYEEINSINNKEIKLRIEQIFKENSQDLYGFKNKEEHELFNNLLKINGIGPKVCLSICSTYNVVDFIHIIKNGDIDSIKKIPGIGPKTAGRLLIELKDINILSEENQNQTNNKYEAEKQTIEALISLGFKKQNIEKILIKCEGQTSSELIKEVLKKIK